MIPTHDTFCGWSCVGVMRSGAIPFDSVVASKSVYSHYLFYSYFFHVINVT